MLALLGVGDRGSSENMYAVIQQVGASSVRAHATSGSCCAYRRCQCVYVCVCVCMTSSSCFTLLCHPVIPSAQVMRRTDTNHTIGNAIIYECVRTATTIYPSPQLLAAGECVCAHTCSSQPSLYHAHCIRPPTSCTNKLRPPLTPSVLRPLACAAADTVSKLLKSPSHNLRYVGIDALAGIVKINPQYAQVGGVRIGERRLR